MDKPLETLPQKPCKSCGSMFTPNSGQQRNCSLECYRKHYYHRPDNLGTRICTCGKEFVIQHGNQKFCDSICMFNNVRAKQKQAYDMSKLRKEQEFLRVNMKIREEHQKVQSKEDALLEAHKATAIEQAKVDEELLAWEKGQIEALQNPLEEK